MMLLLLLLVQLLLERYSGTCISWQIRIATLSRGGDITCRGASWGQASAVIAVLFPQLLLQLLLRRLSRVSAHGEHCRRGRQSVAAAPVYLVIHGGQDCGLVALHFHDIVVPYLWGGQRPLVPVPRPETLLQLLHLVLSMQFLHVSQH